MKILNLKTIGLNAVLSEVQSVRSKSQDVLSLVVPIIKKVLTEGDKALFEFTEKFDGAVLQKLSVSDAEINEAYTKVTAEQLKALKFAANNIEKFHKECLVLKSSITQTAEGVETWREFRCIEKVGLYVPGGLASYPSTVLMLGIPAKVANCKEVIMCTPCNKDGSCNPLVLVAADICGINQIFKLGGSQAIAAMAYGTESIPPVYKIFGPGNQFVSTAKSYVQKDVAIDMPAGPSEILVMADYKQNSEYVAADLLSQLEHGTDSQAILVCDSEDFAIKVIAQTEFQSKKLFRQEIIKESLAISFVVVVDDLNEAYDFVNEYAPEHIEIMTDNDSEILSKLNNFGSAFLGQYSTEPLGDYVTGTNHTLPTSGFAKMYGPLSIESFGKMVQIQKVSKKGFKNLAKQACVLAMAEGLDAHANSIIVRS
jgi:histidinol dehydrogenase